MISIAPTFVMIELVIPQGIETIVPPIPKTTYLLQTAAASTVQILQKLVVETSFRQ